MNYEQVINNFINERYDYLSNCANNILRTNNNVEASELLSELTIHLYSNEKKVQEYINMNRLEGFCVSWMNIQGKYRTSPVNRKHSNIGYELDDYIKDSIPTEDRDTNNVDLTDYEKDLLTQFTEEQVNKIMMVDKIYPYLTKSEQILFDAYFIKNLSYDKIVKRYTFYREKDGKRITYKSKKSIYNLMQGLRKKITELIDG